MPPVADSAPVLAALRAGALCAVSVSGGKDSQALLAAVLSHPDRPNWTGPLVAIHADLGAAEWGETDGFVRAMCDAAGVPLHVVRHSSGGLLERIEARADKLAGTGKPFWPSASNRYCTSDTKRNPIDTLLRSLTPTDGPGAGLVVSVEGVRASESAARAKKPVAAVRRQITGKAYRPQKGDPLGDPGLVVRFRAERTPKARLAFDWRPVLAWTDADVFFSLGHGLDDLERRRALFAAGDRAAALDGWALHPAYVYGNERLSCALCVLACRSDLENGARHNPETFRRYVALERRTGFSFRQDLSLEEVAAGAGIAV